MGCIQNPDHLVYRPILFVFKFIRHITKNGTTAGVLSLRDEVRVFHFGIALNRLFLLVGELVRDDDFEGYDQIATLLLVAAGSFKA